MLFGILPACATHDPFSRRLSAGSRHDGTLDQAFLGELFAWIFFSGMAPYTCTLCKGALWTPVVIGFLIAPAHWYGAVRPRINSQPCRPLPTEQ